MGRKRRFSIILLLAGILLIPLSSEAVKLVVWNALNYPGSTAPARNDDYRTIVNALKPDILVVQEVTSLEGAQQFLSEVMNFTFPGTYAMAPFVDGPDSDNAMFYKKSAITHIKTSMIPTALRNIAEYYVKVRSGPGAGQSFRVFAAHLKSSDGITNKNKRAAEARILRNRMNALPRNSVFVICGDFNLYTSDEKAYKNLVGTEADNDGRVNDPVNSPGKWHDNMTFALLHTQSTHSTMGGGFASGGLDDRFDFILVSDRALTNPKLAYFKNSYVAYGNDGKHFNKAVNVSPYTYPRYITDALYQASDHLPVAIQLLPLPAGPPKAPSSLSAVSTSTRSIYLAWADNSTNETGFRIERSAGAGWAIAGSAAANARNYTDGEVNSSNSYAYRVYAYNAGGSSACSNMTSPLQPGSDITVYITATGEKYHRGNCSYLSSSKIPINLLEAIRKGYTPCSRCNPPTFDF